MYLVQNHVHAQQQERLREAELYRRSHYVVRVRRARRRAERAALQARLVLARAL
jgi:hypothetical protein